LQWIICLSTSAEKLLRLGICTNNPYLSDIN
jgi:hypothetical protein